MQVCKWESGLAISLTIYSYLLLKHQRQDGKILMGSRSAE